ncbi:Hypp760 [Branchiostoma lanceolatum]|uniref:Hypp760 protein n=1 Tax=Branchiostoma lanceolatum TaxID=7740 RepID=A0A8J9VNM7_BRALA|nr:Hypp760 [Branchiostoma lanceolatum]
MTFPDAPSTSNYAQVNTITSLGLSDFTACLQLRTSNTSVGTLFSYAVVNHTDEMVLSGNDHGEYTAFNGDDLSCFNVWSRILPPREADLARHKCGNKGNVFDWSSESWTIHGSVQLIDNQCG